MASRVNRKRASSDGIGWYWEYVTRLVHWYPSFTRDYVLDELPMIEGWCWYNSAYIDDPMHKFAGIKVKNGFIKQESDELVEMAHKVWKEQK